MLLTSCSGKKDNKTISIGYINWDDGIALTHLVEVILEQQGYRVILKNADPAPIYATMARGKVDLLMDAWLPATQADYMKQYGKNLEILGEIYRNARIGLVVPDYVSMNSIEQLNANREKFKGEIIGIDAGAGIMHATDLAIEKYKLNYKLLESSGPAMTAVLKRAIDENRGLDVIKSGEYTVGKWLDLWYESYAKVKMRPSSYLTYRGYIDNHVKPYIGSIPLSKLTTLDLQTLYKKLLTEGRVDRIEAKKQPKGLSAKTVRNIHQIISSALKLAIEQRLIARNPARPAVPCQRRSARKCRHFLLSS